MPVVALLALLTANAAGAVEDPNDKFSLQTIGRVAVQDGDLAIDINATPSAATVEDGKKEIDVVIGTQYGIFVQSQLGANAAFKQDLDNMHELFTKLTPGDRKVHPTTAFRTVGVIDTSYPTRVGLSYKGDDGQSKFVSLQGYASMEQSGKFIALLTDDGHEVKYFDAEALARAISNHDGDETSLDSDALASIGVSESFGIVLDDADGRKMAKKITDGRQHTLQIIDGNGAIVASIDDRHDVFFHNDAVAPPQYEVALQSDKGNAKIRYNVDNDAAELAEPLEELVAA